MSGTLSSIVFGDYAIGDIDTAVDWGSGEEQESGDGGEPRGR